MSACVPYWGHIAKNGYGTICRTHRLELAHRVIYEQCFGYVIDGLALHHTCENRSCVNPEHLQTMTKAEHSRLHNALAGVAAARRAATHCQRGHAFDAANTIIGRGGRRTCRACKVANDGKRWGRAA